MYFDLTTFFNQWLYKPGILELEGQWYYDKIETEIVLEMKQVQAGEILIKMPIEIAIDSKNQNRKIKKIKLSEAYRKYRIKVNEEPANVSLDPNLWVLMNSSLRKKTK